MRSIQIFSLLLVCWFLFTVGQRAEGCLQSIDEKPSAAKETNKRLEARKQSIAMSLAWIAKHQLPDGSWNFDHRIGPGKRGSANPGSATEAKNAATALSLLAFLTADNNHQKGKYKLNVDAGIKYLLANQEKMKSGSSYEERGGTMYSHGMVSMALCEAYESSRDMILVKPAQAAVDYLVYAQDPVGGGWRYMAKQPGDTSIFGWQMRALVCADSAGLDVPF